MFKRKKIIAYALVCSLFLSQGTYAKAAEVSDTSGGKNEAVVTDVRKQDDFYSSVNKDWLNNTVIKDGHTDASSFSDVEDNVNEQMKNLINDLIEKKDIYSEKSDEKKIINLYENYMNNDERNKQGIEPARKILEKIKNIKSLDELSNLYKDNIENTIINIVCDVDLKDATKYALYITNTELSLGNSDEYTKQSEESMQRRQIVANRYIKLLTLAGYSEDEAKTKVDNCFKFEDMIAPSIIGLEESSKDDKIFEKEYNVVTIDELDKMAPNIKIKEYLKNLKVDNANKIILEQPEWLKALNNIYKEENLQLFKDYIEIKNLASCSSFLSDDFTKVNVEFANQYGGTNGDRPQNEKALSIVGTYLDMPLGRLYSERYFDSQTKANVEDMIKNIIDNYKKRIQKLDWMSDVTKENAINKLDKLAIHVGYPDKWDDYSSVDVKSYAEGGSLLQNIMNIEKFLEEKQLKKLNTTVDKDEFLCPPQMVNAFYNPCNNSITIPAGILQKPFYDVNASKEQNYGGIGCVIGHELSHAFDDNTGSKFDSDGNLKDWWTAEDYSKFKQKTQKVKDYYNTVKMDDGTTVNGDITVGEDMADIGGMACVLDIIDGMDNPNYQDFFESFARIWCDKYTPEYLTNSVKFDPHPVGKVRTNVTLAQFEQFYKTYGITENDKMYIKPEDRIQIW